jgi:hypothetical protein
MSVGIVLALIFLVITSLVILARLARRSTQAETELEEDLGDSGVRSANVLGLGLQSRGRAQVRGNGRLALTDGELRFRQLVPARETTIALEAVTSVGTERTWLGKWVGSKLLCVRWRTSDGDEDAMAWQVRDLDGWLTAIQAQVDASKSGAS